jgi:hypothetical protein
MLDVVLRARLRASMRTRDRRFPMGVCANFLPNRSSRLAAYTGHGMMCARLRAYGCALALAEPPIFIAESQWVFVPIFGPIGPAVWPPILDNTTQNRDHFREI